MVATFIAWPGFVCRLFLMESVGMRRLPRTCTSSISSCCPCDCAGVGLRKVQKIRKSVAFNEEAPVEKAAIVVSLTVRARKRSQVSVNFRQFQSCGWTDIQKKEMVSDVGEI